mgnify:FL=1
MLKRFYIKASTTYDERPDLDPNVTYYDGRPHRSKFSFHIEVTFATKAEALEIANTLETKISGMHPKTNKFTVESVDYKNANHMGYSDVNPFDIVKVVSPKTIEVRAVDTEADESVKLNFVQGGFSHICTNDRAQKWFYKSNPDNHVFRIRLSKNRGWVDSNGARYNLDTAPHKFYDNNF